MRWKCLLLIFFLVPVFFITYPLIKVQNVFDEMYYAMPETRSFPLTSTYYTNSSRVRYINRESIDEFGWFIVQYDESFLENAYIQLLGNILRKELYIRIGLNFEDYLETEGRSGYRIWIEYKYDVSSKILVAAPLEVYSSEYSISERASRMNRTSARNFLIENGIDKEQIEEWNQHYLYDKVLADWFQYNRGKTKFSSSTLGNAKIVWDQW
jgi:hypothetical protein